MTDSKYCTHGVIDTQCSLESFRRFIIESTCSSYIPESYASDYEIFAERDADLGSIYVEAADKQTLKNPRCYFCKR